MIDALINVATDLRTIIPAALILIFFCLGLLLGWAIGSCKVTTRRVPGKPADFGMGDLTDWRKQLAKKVRK